jgi:acetoacetate decarboxylase
MTEIREENAPMAKLRYVKTLEQVKRAAEANPEFLKSEITTLRAVYETDPAIAAAVLPQPLEPTARPEVSVVVSNVKMHMSPEFVFEIGAGSLGVMASYDGVEGAYLIAMPMTTEAAVVGGRETFGEPKKLADIAMKRDGDQISASVDRMGISYLELRGTIGEPIGSREYTDHAYCFKALPAIDKTRGFDGDPLLVRLEWHHEDDVVHRVDGEVILRESSFDPVVDIPVRKLVRMEYEEGTTQSTGKVLRSVPGEWLLPFIHGRYDDTSGEGIEI